MSMSPCSSAKPLSASWIEGAIRSARFMVPYFSRAYSMPETEPGTPTARCPLVLRPLTTLPSLSRYMLAVAASGAFSRKSRKVLRPSASCTVMKPPPPRLPAAGYTTASA
jgi:hypothetical protein